jgi:glycosyltransferase involved in cell wall biosynthesis
MKAESGGPVNVLLLYKSILDRIGIDNNIIQTDQEAFFNLKEFIKKPKVIYFSHCIWDIRSYIYFIFCIDKYIFSHGMLAKKAFFNASWKKKLFSNLFYTLINIMNVKIIFGSKQELDQSVFIPRQHIILANPVESSRVINKSSLKSSRRGKTKFVYFSRFDKRKGLLELLNAFISLPSDKSEFHIVGLKSDLEYEERVTRFIENIPNIILHKNLTGVKARKIMQRCDIICLWSDFEGQPMSILEGVADGLLPLVSPNCNLPFETMNYFGLGDCKEDTDLKTIFNYFNVFSRQKLEELRKNYISSNLFLNEINKKVENFLRQL